MPRTAGWGYPEPYTRDWMIASLGILASGNEKLIGTLRQVLITVAKNQSEHGHIPSLVHDPEDRGASDTTPLFLLAAALFCQATGEIHFLDEAVQKALIWMDYQSPDDRIILSQLPTSDWRDEQWILGYGLFINTIYYAVLRLFGYDTKASRLKELMSRFVVRGERQHRHVHEGLVMPHKPYYAIWSYKVHRSERFDLLGNSLAILTGIASPTRSKSLVQWIERECDGLRKKGKLSGDLPPCLFPFIQSTDPDWRPRYEMYNRPGEYHNGGIWPFICAFYIVAVLASGQKQLAEKKLYSLTELVRHSRNQELDFGFNEWHKAQNASPSGQDWQTWSAAMYLYATICLEKGKILFFEQEEKVKG
ncbi:amylo-alpha-1,6-glucosidase [bacterium]|nr:amylo-alpha-1,6-glucosidase [bacterium]RQV96369.1 MAG: amylo-alpha-1,6-glucosidase [bacterium]